MTRPRPLIAVGLACLALTACGLKPQQFDAVKAQSGGAAVGAAAAGGAAGAAGTTGGATGTGTGGVTPPGAAGGAGSAPGASAAGAPAGGGAAAGQPVGGAAGASRGGAPTGGGSTGGGPAGGGATGARAGQPAAAQAAGGRKPCDAPSGGDTTGITSTTIRIGIHAPQTGTGAPLPPSFKDGVQVYWNQPEHKICGRQVIVDFQDDKYTPATARDVCGPMSRSDFLVVGAAGTDQIQSCATMPDIAGRGVPYLSAGVTTNGLTSLPHYFAFTLTYAQQSELVLRNARNQGFGTKKWAVVTSRTDNFKDARESMESVLKQAGIAYDDIQVDATNDNGLQSRAAQTGAQLRQGGYDTVYVDTAPGYFVYMSGAAAQQLFYGPYTGPGVTMTEVTVAQLVCSGTQNRIKASFLAPFPGIDQATADFKKATGGKYDDIYWSLWGLSQGLEQALNAASSNLTRQNFLATLARSSLPGGVYPPIRFGGGHFGGTGAFPQKIDCSGANPDQTQPGQWLSAGPVLTR